MSLNLRIAVAADIEALCELLLEHGPNPWNYLPEDGVRAHLASIATGQTYAWLAEEGGQLQGFVSYRLTDAFAEHQPPSRVLQPHAYICEAVVHRQQAGRGLGSRLLREVVDSLLAQGLRDIYIDRHEENAVSAGMMRKAGFVELLTYPDPQRRSSGSRRSTLCCLRAEPEK